MPKSATTGETTVNPKADSLAKLKDISRMQIDSELTLATLRAALDDTVGFENWDFSVQTVNYPPNPERVGVVGTLTFYAPPDGEDKGHKYFNYPGIGIAPALNGQSNQAAQEAIRRSLLSALAMAGADVTFPEDEVPSPKVQAAPTVHRTVERAPAPRGPARGDVYLCADCEECGDAAEIGPYVKKDGSQLSPKQVADWAQKVAGRPLCWGHLQPLLPKTNRNANGRSYANRY